MRGSKITTVEQVIELAKQGKCIVRGCGKKETRRLYENQTAFKAHIKKDAEAY